MELKSKTNEPCRQYYPISEEKKIKSDYSTKLESFFCKQCSEQKIVLFIFGRQRH